MSEEQKDVSLIKTKLNYVWKRDSDLEKEFM